MESVSQNNKHTLIQNFSTPAWFRGWPNPDVPDVAVDSIWSGLESNWSMLVCLEEI